MSLHSSSDNAQTAQTESKRLSLGLMALAVLSSIAASSCCVLPLMLVLIGLTGAWMTHLQALKPFIGTFTFIALASLTWAGYLVFRPMPATTNACSTVDRECDGDRQTSRKAFMVCALFIGVLLLFPFAAPLFY